MSATRTISLLLSSCLATAAAAAAPTSSADSIPPHSDSFDNVYGAPSSPHYIISHPDFPALIATHAPIIKGLALKTNAVPWGVVVPNVEVEAMFPCHLSLSIPVWWAPFYLSHSFAVRNLSLLPEIRYYLSPSHRGHSFGLHMTISWFNVKHDRIRYQDVDRPLLGAGISYSYSLYFNPSWGLEFSLGAGFASMCYDRFYNIPHGARIDTRKTTYWGIDRAAISLIYRLPR